MTKLKLKDDTYTYDQFNILQEEKQFYELLYTSKNVDAEKFSHSPCFKPDNITPLSQEDKLACENPISINECLNALKEFTNNKTPGTDIFTSKFYKFFWPELCTEMIVSFNYAFHSGTLTISQKRGIISLIPKKDKDTSLLHYYYYFSLSGLLFINSIELFARALKNDQSIKGINVETKEIKITQYADDTTVFLRDEESWSNS